VSGAPASDTTSTASAGINPDADHSGRNLVS
jgi:predicted histidine transporter YuiF (NhaC family)